MHVCSFKFLSSHDHFFSLHLDTSLTLNNIREILEQMEWNDYDSVVFPEVIGIPDSWVKEHIDHKNATSRKVAWKHWLENHPAPSWALIAEGLYRTYNHHILKQLEIQYPSGKSDYLHIYVPI